MRTFAVVALIGGGSLFFWGGQQASNVGEYPRYLVPESVANDASARRGQFQVLQLLGAVAGLAGGGTLLYGLKK